MSDFLNQICEEVDNSRANASGTAASVVANIDKDNLLDDSENTITDVTSQNDQMHLPELDLTDEFNLIHICQKATQYETDDQVIFDLGKVVRRIIGKKFFVFKAYCSATKAFVLEFRTVTDMKNELKSIPLNFGARETYNVWDCFVKYQTSFCLMRLEFSKESHELFFNLFRGWFYTTDQTVEQSLIAPFMTFVYDVIADGNRVNFEWLVSWLAFIIQRVGDRSGTAIILKGEEGVGKNFFSKAICELFRGYALENITDFELLTGKFNDMLRGKLLVVINELENVKAGKVSSEKLRSLITEDIVAIQAKHKAAEMDVLVSNFILITNNTVPIRMSPKDRRYFALDVSEKHMNDKAYFEKLNESMTPNFYFALQSFLSVYDISKFDAGNIPFTFAKSTMVVESSNDMEQWIIENYDVLRRGLWSQQLFAMKPCGLSKDRFAKELQRFVNKDVKHVGATTKIWYILKVCYVNKYALTVMTQKANKRRRIEEDPPPRIEHLVDKLTITDQQGQQDHQDQQSNSDMDIEPPPIL
jgi:hypothetical protein